MHHFKAYTILFKYINCTNILSLVRLVDLKVGTKYYVCIYKLQFYITKQNWLSLSINWVDHL